MAETATINVRVNGEEARKMIDDLTKRADDLKAAIIQAYKAGDKASAQKFSKQLREVNKDLKNIRSAAQSLSDTLNNLSAAGINDLKHAMSQLTKKLSDGSVARGTAEWKKYQLQLRAVKEEIQRINDESKRSATLYERFSDFFNKYNLAIGAGVAAAAGISALYSEANKYRKQKDSSKASLEALTGLSRETIDELAAEAEVLSTTVDESGLRITQTAPEILEAFKLVGSAKPELLSSKEALKQVTIEATRLSAASGESLKDSVQALTVGLNQFGASAEETVRFTNVIAAGSKEGAAGVGDISRAVLKAGVSAKSAGLSIEELVGSIETLGGKGVLGDIAGTGLKSFLLRLQSMEDDVNPAVVGMSAALDNLSKKGMSVSDMQKAFGMEAFNVASIMIDSVSEFERYTAAVSGTSVAIEQAAINSDTLEKRSAQLKNAMNATYEQLANDLAPIMGSIYGLMSSFLKTLPIVIKWVKENKDILIALSLSLIAYNIEAIKSAVVQSNFTKALLSSSKAIFSQTALLNAKRLATAAYSGTIALLSGNIKHATTYFKLFSAAIKTTPVGLLLTAVVAVGSAVAILVRRLGESSDSVKNLNKNLELTQGIEKQVADSIGKEISKIETLSHIVHNQALSYEERNSALIRLKQLVPDYHAELTREGRLINDNADALERFKKVQLSMARERIINERVAENTSKELEAELRYEAASKAYNKVLESHGGEEGVIKTFTSLGGYTSSSNDIFVEYDDVKAAREARDKAWNEYKQAMNDTAEQNDFLLKYLADTKNNVEGLLSSDAGSSVKTLTDEEIKAMLEQIDDAAAKRKSEAEAQLADGLISQIEYAGKIHDVEQRSFNEKLKLYSADSVEYSELLAAKAKSDRAYKDQLLSDTLSVDKSGVALSGKDELSSRLETLALEERNAQERLRILKEGSSEALKVEQELAGVRRRMAQTRADIEIADVESEYADRKLTLKRQRAEGLISEASYNSELERMEIEHGSRLVDIRRRNGVLTMQEEQQHRRAIAEYEIKQIDSLAKSRDEYVRKYGKKNALSFAGDLETIDTWEKSGAINSDEASVARQKATNSALGGMLDELDSYESKMSMIMSLEHQGLLTHEAAEKAKTEITVEENRKRLEAVTQVYDTVNQVMNAASSYMQASVQAETANVEAEYDKRIKKAGANSKMAQRLEEEKEKKIAAMKTEANRKAMAIQLAQALSNTALSAINAYNSVVGTPFVGPVLAPIAAAAAIAAGMLQVATIRKQHQAQQTGYASGGFTPRGRWDEEQGVVHSGEFVANRFAVQNPELLPAFRLIDQAQRNHTVGRLTASDVSASLRTRTSPDVVSAVQLPLAAMQSIQPVQGFQQERTADTLDRLARTLDNGIVAVASISGQNGIAEQTKRYNRLINNTRR